MNYDIIVKIIAIIVNFSVGLTFGLIPIKLRAFKSNQKVLSFTSAFAGGLFLALGLMHLLPHANKLFEKYFKSQH